MTLPETARLSALFSRSRVMETVKRFSAELVREATYDTHPVLFDSTRVSPRPLKWSPRQGSPVAEWSGRYSRGVERWAHLMPLLVLAIVVNPYEDPVDDRQHPSHSRLRPSPPRALLCIKLEVGSPVRVERSTRNRTSEGVYGRCVRSVRSKDVDSGEGIRQLRSATTSVESSRENCEALTAKTSRLINSSVMLQSQRSFQADLTRARSPAATTVMRGTGISGVLRSSRTEPGFTGKFNLADERPAGREVNQRFGVRRGGAGVRVPPSCR